MKQKIYLRIAKTNSGYSYKVDKKKNHKPMDDGYYKKTYFPTIVVGLNLEIPDRFFKEALAELDLKVENLEVASEIEIKEEAEKIEEVQL